MDSNRTKAIVVAAIVGALALGSVGIAGAAGVKALSGSKSATTTTDTKQGAKSGPDGTKNGATRDGARGDHADGKRGARGFGGQGDIAEALAKLSGLTEDQIRAKRAAGTSYADIAKSKGVSTDALIAETVKIETAELDAAIKAGKLTEAKKAEVLGDIETRLADEIKRTDAPKDRDGKRGGHGDRDGDGQHGPRGSKGSKPAPSSGR